MKQVKAYLANQLGFSETGKFVLEKLIKPRLEEFGITINDPFVECGKELDMEHFSKLEKYEDRIKYMEDFSRKITPINNKLMEESDCLIAILDGGHAVDDGVASEIGYWAGTKKDRPIFALRSDFRCGENVAVTINPQIIGYISLSGGYLADGPGAVDKFFMRVREWAVSKRYEPQK